ncbi:MAG: hypothetical protein R3B65_00020 [Candidatus Paceibacterota bacterium]
MKDISAESDFTNIEPPLLSDFEMVLSGLEGSESVSTRLLKFTQGTWKNFLNQPTNVDINRKFIVFSVRDMEDDLKPVAMYIITHFIWNAVRKNLKKRLLIVDEAWWMMKSEDTASFLYSIAKRGRKYYLGLSTITQDVNDFINSPYGMPIVTNSSMQLLLKQSTSSADALQKVFNLTDEEKYLLLESEVGEGIFFAGLKHVAIKIIASYTEDQIITSDPSQILAIQKAKEEYLEEEGQGSGSSPSNDESYKINYKEEPKETISEKQPEKEAVNSDQKEEYPEQKIEEKPEKSIKINENQPESDTEKMEAENKKLDAEIEELEKMFRDQI